MALVLRVFGCCYIIGVVFDEDPKFGLGTWIFGGYVLRLSDEFEVVVLRLFESFVGVV